MIKKCRYMSEVKDEGKMYKLILAALSLKATVGWLCCGTNPPRSREREGLRSLTETSV